MRDEVGIVILCGARKGENIKEYKLRFRTCKIYAIEPWPESFERMKALYGDDPNIVLINKAAWSSNGTHKMWGHGMSMSNSLYDREDGSGCLEVETMDLAEFLEQFESVKCLRVDIEGSEYEVLLHCFDKGVMKKVENLHLELHGNKIRHITTKQKSELDDKLHKWDPNGVRTTHV